MSSGSPSRARMNEMPDGPPVPVTRTRRRRSASADIDGRVQRRAGGDGNRRGVADVALAYDLERLDVARLGEPAPVAGGRAQQLLVEVAPDRGLRAVGPDRLELAVHELVDGHEAGRPELDGGRRRLVAVDAGDAAGRDERGVVHVAVVLVHVAGRVRVDRRRVDLVDDLLDR